MKGLRPLARFAGIDSMLRESSKFEAASKAIYEITANQVFGVPNPKGFALYAYGSPGRREMIGGDADADIFIVESPSAKRAGEFRKLFVSNMSHLDYSKVDLPDWGRVDEVEIYLQKSLVEGNQVLETRFLSGDNELDKEFEALKRKYNSPGRAIQNIVFNRLYLDAYFEQKVRDGALNVKYCQGGSRELLFLGWYDDLMRTAFDEKPTSEPKALSGLRRLHPKRLGDKALESSLEAINFISILRTDMLAMNRKTRDRGLTFLDEPTLEGLRRLGYPSSDEVKQAFEYHRRQIRNAVDIAYSEVLSFGGDFHSASWERDIRLAQTLLSHEERATIKTTDPAVKMALIWGAANFGQRGIFEELSEQNADSENWGVIGSIVCSPLCKPRLLERFGTGIAREKGYGYLLRVIARNPNTPRETLVLIANDPNLEKRYTEIAAAALRGGVKEANQQI